MTRGYNCFLTAPAPLLQACHLAWGIALAAVPGHLQRCPVPGSAVPPPLPEQVDVDVECVLQPWRRGSSKDADWMLRHLHKVAMKRIIEMRWDSADNGDDIGNGNVFWLTEIRHPTVLYVQYSSRNEVGVLYSGVQEV